MIVHGLAGYLQNAIKSGNDSIEDFKKDCNKLAKELSIMYPDAVKLLEDNKTHS